MSNGLEESSIRKELGFYLQNLELKIHEIELEMGICEDRIKLAAINLSKLSIDIKNLSESAKTMKGEAQIVSLSEYKSVSNELLIYSSLLQKEKTLVEELKVNLAVLDQEKILYRSEVKDVLIKIQGLGKVLQMKVE